MRENMEKLQHEVTSLMSYVRDELLKNEGALRGRFEQALVRVERGALVLRREAKPAATAAGEGDDAPRPGRRGRG
jgi:hypothetical protein